MAIGRQRYTGGLVDLASGRISREIFVSDVMDADGWDALATWRRGASS